MQKETLALILLAFCILPQTALAQTSTTVYLDTVPYHSQEKGDWCGPAALQMVLGFWGIDLSQKTIASAVYKESNNGTTTDDIVNYTRSLGFQNTPMTNTSISQLKDCINKGLPVIVLQKISANDSGGHYRVVVGYSENCFITHDSDTYGNYYIAYSLFVDLWNYTTNNWMLVLEPAEHAPVASPVNSLSEEGLLTPSASPEVPEFGTSFAVMVLMCLPIVLMVFVKKRTAYSQKWLSKIIIFSIFLSYVLLINCI